MKNVDITCDLLIPSDEDDAEVEEVTCIKCNGTQMNKKGLPCRKCNGRGTLVSKEISAISAMVRQEVQEYCYQSFKTMFTRHLEVKKLSKMLLFMRRLHATAAKLTLFEAYATCALSARTPISARSARKTVSMRSILYSKSESRSKPLQN